MKQFKQYYTSPYKVSNDVREEVQGYRTTCDAYTLMTDSEYEVNVLSSKWAKYSAFAQKNGNKVKPFRNNQYVGWQVASMRYGNIYGRLDTMLAVTGNLADVTLEEMLSFSLRASRVDIACTFDLSSPFPDYASQMYDARVLSGENGRTPLSMWKLIQSERGDTLYVGKRGTGKFLRVYDKTFEATGITERGYVWRFEMEYSTGYADPLWQQLRIELENERSIPDYMIRRLWGDSYAKGVALPVRIEELGLGDNKKDKQHTDKDRYISWLNKTVRPAVQWLIAMGYGEEVAEALGIQQNFMDILEQNELLKATISLQGPDGGASL